MKKKRFILGIKRFLGIEGQKVVNHQEANLGRAGEKEVAALWAQLAICTFASLRSGHSLLFWMLDFLQFLGPWF